MRRGLDIFIDTTNSPTEEIPAFARSLVEACELRGSSVDLIVEGGAEECAHFESPDVRVVRLRKDANNTEALNLAISHAVKRERHLLILTAPLLISSDVVGILIDALDHDPMFGWAIPRIEYSFESMVHPLATTSVGEGETNRIPSFILAEMPHRTIVPEFVSNCTVIRFEILANFPSLDQTCASRDGALLRYLTRARRVGYRSVVCNRAVVKTWKGCDYLIGDAVAETDRRALHERFPCSQKASAELSRNMQPKAERVFSKLSAALRGGERTLLIDARDLDPWHNGTSQSFFGLADSIASIATNWKITISAKRESQDFHDLASRYGVWEIVDDRHEGAYAIVYRINQPWGPSDVVYAHNQGFLNYFSMLDTIAWDILFPVSPPVECAWNFCSQYADGLLYISNYTRDRFNHRFPVGSDVAELVTYLSLDPNDYVPKRPSGTNTEQSPYILLVGNNYDHKFIEPTTDLLVKAFPHQLIKAFGLESSTSTRVLAYPSGLLDDAEVDELYNRASVIVFPSFYEGFGFPVLRGLACERTVIARQTPLIDEIAAKYRGPGRLVTFASESELVEKVGKILHDKPVESKVFGTHEAVKDGAMSYKVIAKNLLDFFDRELHRASFDRWRRRERAVSCFRW